MASTEPARIRAKAAVTPAVSGSSRNSAPAATATAGSTYGPASLISSRKATKATAVQSTPRPAGAASTCGYQGRRGVAEHRQQHLAEGAGVAVGQA
ncbi:hypothetical protein [Streptomyces sp. NPDC001508]|uniref:hypothetical protein n=1 Tax=Streptomyces sp. NPDC001508 TaxID=3154656 RepID=UPI003323DD75